MRTFDDCEAYLRQVGLATAIPSRTKQLLPCLLWAARGHRRRLGEWDDAIGRVWAWKDDLPDRRRAWSGWLFGTQVVILHVDLLPSFLRWCEAPSTVQSALDLYHDGLLSREARDLLKFLDGAGGPMGRRELRAAASLAGKANASRFDRALRELERRMITTRAGRVSEGSGWDSCTYDLVARRFPDQVDQAAGLAPREAAWAVEEALRHACSDASEADLRKMLRR